MSTTTSFSNDPPPFTSTSPSTTVTPTTSTSICQPVPLKTTTSILYFPGPDRANWDGINYVRYRITDDECTEVIEAQIDPVTAPTPDGITPPALPTVTFTDANFLSYAVTTFSVKFPFGIVGDISGISGSNNCPTWTFLGVQITLCIVRDAVAILKYPAIIAFLIRTYRHV